MGSAAEPQQVSVDPTPEVVQPLQRQLASLLGQVFAGAGMDAPLFEQALNLPTFGEQGRFAGTPFAAGPEQAQLDALQGFQQAFDPTRIVDNQVASGTLQDLLGGGSFGGTGIPSGGQEFRDALGGFDVGSTADPFLADVFGGAAPETADALSGLGQDFQQAREPARFDLTETFQRGEEVFQGDLERALADVREEASAFGLNPGSSDRNDRLLRTAGDLSSRFRLGQLGQAQGAFESAEQRRLGALGLAPSIASATEAPRRTTISALPGLLEREQQPFERFLGTTGLRQEGELAREGLGLQGQLGALGQIPGLSRLPLEQAQGLFGLGEGLRQIEDSGIQRQIGEFARTQGGRLNQLLGLISGSPLQQTSFGPSKLSQVGQVAQGAGSLAGGIGGG